MLRQSSGVCVIFSGEGKRSEQESADSRSAPGQTRPDQITPSPGLFEGLSGQHVSPEEYVSWWCAVPVKALLAREQTGRQGACGERAVRLMMNWVLDIRPYCIGIMTFVVRKLPPFWTFH